MTLQEACPEHLINNVGLTEKIKLTKRVSIGPQGDGVFNGNIPCINIGDSDSGFTGPSDGRIDIYSNNTLVGYIDGAGLHMQREIASAGTLWAGNARLVASGDIYGSVWGNNWLSAWLSNAFASRDNNINTRATRDWVAAQGYATQSWVLQYFVQNIDHTAPTEIQFWDGRGYPRGTDGAAMYNFSMVGGASNVGWIVVRYTRKQVNNTWYVIN